MKKCSKCKELLDINNFNKCKHSKDGLQYSCKNCRRKFEQSLQFKEQQKTWRNTLKGKRKFYVRNAKRRQVAFLLTDKEFQTFWQKPCAYCNSEILTVGIDRVSSEKGYELDNCVPCCSICNWMKMDLSINDFKNHILKIANHLNL